MENKILRTSKHEWERTALLLILFLLLVAVGYIIKIKYIDEQVLGAYQQGIVDGQVLWNNYVLTSIRQQGRIPMISNGTEQFIDVQQLCGGQR